MLAKVPELTQMKSNFRSIYPQSSIEWKPEFVDVPPPPLGANSLLLICMCFMAYFCHYNAPRYYIELQRNTIPRFTKVTNVSFGISACVYFIVGVIGYYTFGASTDGFVLNNYSQNDDLASACRFAIAVALSFTYPLPFIGTRDGILDLFSVSQEWQNSTNLNFLTVAMLSGFTALVRTSYITVSCDGLLSCLTCSFKQPGLQVY